MMSETFGVKRYIHEAEGLWDCGQREKAIQLLLVGTAAKPHNVLLLCHTAFRLSLYGRHDEAITMLQKKLQANPTETKCIVMLANVFRRAGRLMEGAVTAQQGLGLEKSHPGCEHALANIFLQMGRYDEAIKIVRNGLETRPQDKKLLHVAASAYLGIGDYDAFDLVIARLSGDPLQPHLCAKKFYLQDQLGKALNLLTRTMSLSFDERACALYIAIVGPDVDNPVIRLIRAHMATNDHRFDDIFQTAHRMRTDRKALLALDLPVPIHSPVLSDPRFSIRGAINKAAFRDGGLRC